MRTATHLRRLYACLALCALLLSLVWQPLGAALDGAQSSGQAGVVAMSESCTGCGELEALDSDCIDMDLFCVHLPAAAIGGDNLFPWPAATVQSALQHDFHTGLFLPPEPQPPRITVPA